ncbi:MAG TPA: hypothetical protein VD970_06035 [Acetobacteraceae bacterium]|nr:hypothetical protein [Acetobacteraceae bacterium]
MTEQDAARAALDHLIAEPQPCTMEKAREAMEALVAWRDALAARRRAGEAVEADLIRANAAIAFTWSAAIPVTGFKPGRLEKARAMLNGD